MYNSWFKAKVKKASTQALIQVLTEMRKPNIQISSAMEQYGQDITEADIMAMRSGAFGLSEIDMNNLNAIESYLNGSDQQLQQPLMDQPNQQNIMDQTLA